MVTTAQSLRTLQFSDMDLLELRLKTKNDLDSLRRVCVELNQLLARIDKTTLPVRARYALLRGVLYAKVGAHRSASWLGTSQSSLMLALEQLAEADRLLQRCAGDTFRTLQRAVAYEAAAVVTLLRVRGTDLTKMPVTPNTSCLSTDQQRLFTRALQGNYPLTSHFR